MSGQGAKVLQGFAPGIYDITGYGAGGFRFGDGLTHKGEIMALPDGIHALDVTSPQHLTSDALANFWQVAAQYPEQFELALFGMGTIPWPLGAGLISDLKARNIRFDVMTTGSAVRTYHVLRGEGRRVVAVLFAVD